MKRPRTLIIVLVCIILSVSVLGAIIYINTHRYGTGLIDYVYGEVVLTGIPPLTNPSIPLSVSGLTWNNDEFYLLSGELTNSPTVDNFMQVELDPNYPEHIAKVHYYHVMTYEDVYGQQYEAIWVNYIEWVQ